MFKHISILSFAIVASLSTNMALADENNNSMTPPKPVYNKMLDSMVGTWKGESEMMGAKMNDTLRISWSINHQFLIIELQSKEIKRPENHYEGIGMFGVDANGKVKTWWFDSWGVPLVTTGTGTTRNNQLVIKDTNSVFKEERSFEVKGDQMTMQAKGIMKTKSKGTAFEQTVVYTR